MATREVSLNNSVVALTVSAGTGVFPHPLGEATFVVKGANATVRFALKEPKNTYVFSCVSSGLAGILAQLSATTTSTSLLDVLAGLNATCEVATAIPGSSDTESSSTDFLTFAEAKLSAEGWESHHQTLKLHTWRKEDYLIFFFLEVSLPDNALDRQWRLQGTAHGGPNVPLAQGKIPAKACAPSRYREACTVFVNGLAELETLHKDAASLFSYVKEDLIADGWAYSPRFPKKPNGVGLCKPGWFFSLHTAASNSGPMVTWRVFGPGLPDEAHEGEVYVKEGFSVCQKTLSDLLSSVKESIRAALLDLESLKNLKAVAGSGPAKFASDLSRLLAEFNWPPPTVTEGNRLKSHRAYLWSAPGDSRGAVSFEYSNLPDAIFGWIQADINHAGYLPHASLVQDVKHESDTGALLASLRQRLVEQAASINHLRDFNTKAQASESLQEVLWELVALKRRFATFDATWEDVRSGKSKVALVPEHIVDRDVAAMQERLSVVKLKDTDLYLAFLPTATELGQVVAAADADGGLLLKDVNHPEFRSKHFGYDADALALHAAVLKADAKRREIISTLRGTAIKPLSEAEVATQIDAGRVVPKLVPLAAEKATAFIKQQDDPLNQVARVAAKITVEAEIARRVELAPAADLEAALLRHMQVTRDYTGLGRTDILVREVTEVLASWAQSAGDHSVSAIVTQMAATSEFNLPIANLNILRDFATGPEVANRDLWESAKQQFVTDGPLRQMILRKMYDWTQEELSAAGIHRLSLFRGMKLPQLPPVFTLLNRGDQVVMQVALQPLSSWSSRREVSLSFTSISYGSILLQATAPARRVLASARTGLGCLSEYEFILLDTGVNNGEYLVEQLAYRNLPSDITNDQALIS